jgi:hypothetical protein
MSNVLTATLGDGFDYLEIPLEVQPPTMSEPKMLVIYGKEKIGKTTLLAQQLPHFLHLDTQQGTKYIHTLRQEITSLPQLQAIQSRIAHHGHPYSGVILDVVDTIEDMCVQMATWRWANSTKGKTFHEIHGPTANILCLDRGLGYGLLRDEFRLWLGVIQSMAYFQILICHPRDKFMGKEDTFVSPRDLNLTGKVCEILNFEADATGYMYRNAEGTPMISFKNLQGQAGGGRVPHLIEQEFELDFSKIYKDSYHLFTKPISNRPQV